MSKIRQFSLAVAAGSWFAAGALAQTAAPDAAACPARPQPGSAIHNPADLTSQNGVLNAAFTLRSVVQESGFQQDCYIYKTGKGAVEAPTLRLNPGDTLKLSLTNRLTYSPPPPPSRSGAMAHMMSAAPSATACAGGPLIATSTNIHFHGLNVPPTCHKDDVLTTDIANTDPPFHYDFAIPKNDPPGLYWYHPHLHGETTLQVNAGAAGALIINGIEKFRPEVARLPERVFVIRQQFPGGVWLPGPYELTVNYQPANFPNFPAPVLNVKPGVQEFWRVANATTQAFLKLQVWSGTKPQSLEVVALDGIPLAQTVNQNTIEIPPAGRAEFIVTTPAAGAVASFQNLSYNTGSIGNANLAEELARIVSSTGAEEPPALPAATPAPATPQRFAGLADATVTARRKLYFAEATSGSNGPTEFLMGVEGIIPKVFSPADPPAIVTKVGAVEDWTVENRTGETHAFHIHQIHFLYLELNGKKLPNPALRDTVIVPFWNGTGPYPSVKLRMDFREPQIAGTFVFHCHVLEHEDYGMMQKIEVDPK